MLERTAGLPRFFPGRHGQKTKQKEVGEVKLFMFKKDFHRLFQAGSAIAVIVLCLCADCVCRAADPVYLAFGGDVMLCRDVAQSVLDLGQGDYRFPWQHIAGTFSPADIAFVNLESPITDKGSMNLAKQAPWFRAKPAAMTGLLYAGINVVSVANNHALDYGRNAFEDSLNRLKSAGITYTGGGLTYADAYSPKYVTVKGRKIAFLGFTIINYSSWSASLPYTYFGFKFPGKSGIAWLSESALKQGIAMAKEAGANLIVVSMHWGEEYHTQPNATQQKYAHLAIDQGADLVVGHHPHVVQPVEIYKGKYIFYSMGNLIFDQSESSHTGVTRGGVVLVTCRDNGISAVNEVFTTIDEQTCQPWFK
jgi:poly-gamma-glutamate capsule biosynthesis protein CapA/YwtB (metallophosphatase superfamily)